MITGRETKCCSQGVITTASTFCSKAFRVSRRVRIDSDSKRDFFMSAFSALIYGLIDKIINKTERVQRSLLYEYFLFSSRCLSRCVVLESANSGTGSAGTQSSNDGFAN
ncbi:MAG: ATP-dependent Clp protease proteolytic subunit [Hassallia sp.]